MRSLEGFGASFELCKENMATAEAAGVLVGFIFAHYWIR